MIKSDPKALALLGSIPVENRKQTRRQIHRTFYRVVGAETKSNRPRSHADGSSFRGHLPEANNKRQQQTEMWWDEDSEDSAEGLAVARPRG